MKSPTLKPLVASALAACLLLPIASPAQPQSAPAAQASPELRRHHDMGALMDDMAQQLTVMREQMAKGGMTAASEKEMSAKMKRLSELMSRMSGLMDRPTMKEPEAAKQLAQMRKQMDELKQGHPMPAGPAKAGR